MTYWFRICLCVIVFSLGRGMNIWTVRVHGGIMSSEFPLGDWIPIAQRWLVSVGDVLQLTGLVAIILATFIKFCDERYMRRGGRDA